MSSGARVHVGLWEPLLPAGVSPGPRFAVDGFGVGSAVNTSAGVSRQCLCSQLVSAQTFEQSISPPEMAVDGGEPASSQASRCSAHTCLRACLLA